MADQVVIQFSTAAPSSYLPFSRGWKNRFSKAICWLGHSQFSHVDFRLEDGSLLGASDNPMAPIIYGNPRGVAVRPHDYQSFGIRRHMIIRTDRADAIIAYAKSQVGKPFDNGALRNFLSIKFPNAVDARDWRHPDRWFCAELVIVSFEQGGYWNGEQLPWPKTRVSPTDTFFAFMMDPNFINKRTFFQVDPLLKMGVHER